jgi:hypothetical protein
MVVAKLLLKMILQKIERQKYSDSLSLPNAAKLYRFCKSRVK